MIRWLFETGYSYIASAVTAPSSWLGAFVGLLISAILPGTNGGMWLALLLVLMVLDIVAGLLASWFDHTPIVWDKARGILGKFFGYCLVIAVAGWSTLPLPHNMSIVRDWLVLLAVWLLIACEGRSILRHARRLKAPIPKALVSFLDDKIEELRDGKKVEDSGPRIENK
jgi:toxin secretion/phage lysis holin